jgi:hypothetical protein
VHPHAEPGIQAGSQVEAVPGQVGGLEHRAPRVDDARAADAHAEQRAVGRLGQVDAQRAGQFERGVARAAVALGGAAFGTAAGEGACW